MPEIKTEVTSSELMNNFFAILKGLNDEKKIEAVNIILAKYREQNATDGQFYNKPAEVKKVSDVLFSMIRTTDFFIETLIKVEAAGPYSVFSYVLSDNYSDFIIFKDGMILSDGSRVNKIQIPKELQKIYQLFMNHFIENVMFLAGKKFDTGNSIVDAEIGIFRFNLIHSSLPVNRFHCMAIRKQTISKGFNMDPQRYLDSLGATEKQKEVINKYAISGNTIIFGTVGSGKTTLMKYMGNYHLEEKRNLCTIEDTPELYIPVPISLVTNHHKNIKDLFTASLRQNPSHILIGETRTDEIVDILESALTISVITTIHANSFERAIQRIIFMSAERSILSEDMRDLINAAVDCFIFMENRKVKGIWEHKKEHHKDVFEAYEEVK